MSFAFSLGLSGRFAMERPRRTTKLAERVRLELAAHAEQEMLSEEPHHAQPCGVTRIADLHGEQV